VRLVHERPGACGFFQHLPTLLHGIGHQRVGLDGRVLLGFRDDLPCLLAGGAEVLIGLTARFLPDPVGFLLGLDKRLADQALLLAGALEVLRELTGPPFELRAFLRELADALAHRAEQLDDRRALVAEQSPRQLGLIDLGWERGPCGPLVVRLRSFAHVVDASGRGCVDLCMDWDATASSRPGSRPPRTPGPRRRKGRLDGLIGFG